MKFRQTKNRQAEKYSVPCALRRRTIKWAIAALLSLGAGQAAQADTFTVTTAASNGPGSLEQAVMDAVSEFGADRIVFNIPGNGPHVIFNASVLIQNLNATRIEIDGTTQPGYDGRPRIHLRDCYIYPETSGNVFKGLTVTRSSGAADTFLIALNSPQNRVENCYIGIDPFGTYTNSGLSDGIVVNGTQNVIGGSLAKRNYIGGSGRHGILCNGTNNDISGNFIGLKPDGSALGNAGSGIFMDDEADGNQIGKPGIGNVISANSGDGIFLTSTYGSTGANNNKIQGNFIGLDPNATAARSNGGNGIHMERRASDNTIGGSEAGAGNYISANGGHGIYLDAPDESGGTNQGPARNVITANIIGLNSAGADLGNTGDGIRSFSFAHDNKIGLAGVGNVISGNGGNGVRVLGAVYGAPKNESLLANYIGTNQAGNVAVPNTKNGVHISINAENIRIGSPTAGEGNVISGNTERGIVVEQGVKTTPIEGNFIGTNLAGTGALPNLAGLLVQTGAAAPDGTSYGAPTGTIVGGFGSARNVISGNTNTGVRLLANVSLIEANIIGLDVTGTAALGNLYGIEVGVGNQNIGRAGAGNIVSGNRSSGILISGAGTGGAVQILGNFIGTNGAGNGSIGNARDGVEITATNQNNVIGANGAGNLIAGNGRHGISIGGSGQNSITFNLIGTNGAADLGNAGNGIYCNVANQIIGAANAGNVIAGNGLSGLFLLTSGHQIHGNNIGNNGGSAIPNGGHGIESGVANTIGGDGAGEGNTISGNSLSGILVAAAGMVVKGNRIGCSTDTRSRVPNGQDGISLIGTNRSATVQGNYLSGNTRDGIRIEGSGGNLSLVANRIGLSDGAANSIAVANGGHGVNYLSGGPVAVGTASGGNFISGNTLSGVNLAAPLVGSSVAYNVIGLNATGTAAVGNGQDGITVTKTETNAFTLGGAGIGNVISGNGRDGIRLTGSGTGTLANVSILGNSIGTNNAGNAKVANAGHGIYLLTAANCTIGGAGTARNVVSGNGGRGIYAQNAGGIVIKNNLIGTDAVGTAALGNGTVGVLLQDCSPTQVGGNTAGDGNVISGNVNDGLRLLNGVNHTVSRNIIGADSNGTGNLGNGLNGILISSDGPAVNGNILANTIAFNGQSGINILGTSNGANPAFSIAGNSTFSNGGLGINLQPVGEANNTVTPNDGDDADNGPNTLLNAPTIQGVLTSGGNTVIKGVWNSAPNLTGRLEFFRNSGIDPSGYGEGRTYIDDLTVSTNADGVAPFTFTAPGVFTGQYFCATAGTSVTSEFSNSVQEGTAQGVYRFSAPNYSVNEGGGSLTVTVTRTGGNGAGSVQYNTGTPASADAGQDYTATSGTLTFTGSETTKTFTVAILNDAAVEGDEFFRVELSNPQNGTTNTPESAIVTILDDDGNTNPTLAVNDVSVTETNGGSAQAQFTVTLSKASAQTVTVKVQSAPGGSPEATVGADYTAVPLTTITFAPGQVSKAVNVTLLGDTLDENDEKFALNLSAAVNATIADGTGICTIMDNDAAPSVAASAPNVTEGNSGTKTMTFTISLSAASARNISVQYQTANATTFPATAGSDYTAVGLTTVIFNAGQTTKTVPVTIKGDTLDEDNEHITLALSNPGNATLGTNSDGIIVDDDATPGLSINDVSVVEGPAQGAPAGTKLMNFTITLSAASGRSVTVKAQTGNGGSPAATSGTDYLPLALTTLTFTTGQTTKQVSVSIKGDTTVEVNEKLAIILSAAVNASIADNAGIGTILNDDAAGTSAPSTAPESQDVSAEASSSSSSVTLFFADAQAAQNASGFSIRQNGKAGTVKSEMRNGGTVTLLLPNGSLESGDEILVFWTSEEDANSNSSAMALAE